MIIKNFYIENSSDFINSLCVYLSKNNINYLVIKNDLFMEVHFDNYIYNIYSNYSYTSKTYNNSVFSNFNPIEKENTSPSYPIYKDDKKTHSIYKKNNIKNDNKKFGKTNSQFKKNVRR